MGQTPPKSLLVLVFAESPCSLTSSESIGNPQTQRWEHELLHDRLGLLVLRSLWGWVGVDSCLHLVHRLLQMLSGYGPAVNLSFVIELGRYAALGEGGELESHWWISGQRNLELAIYKHHISLTRAHKRGTKTTWEVIVRLREGSGIASAHIDLGTPTVWGKQVRNKST